MDHKAIISHLSKRLGCDTRQAATLVAAFSSAIRDKASELDTIAIPGFGNFVAMKQPEKIATNPETGKRTLTPPSIKLQFVAGSMLKKHLSE